MRWILLLAVTTMGCASWGYDVFRGPSGGEAYSVWCRRGIKNCFEGAGELCPSGYVVVGEEEGKYAIVNLGNKPQLVHGPDELMIECRPTQPVTAAR